MALLGVSLYVTFCFSLAAFIILSLSLIFCHFNTIWLDVFLFGFTVYKILYILRWLFSFPSLGSFQLLSFRFFLSLFSFWNPYTANISALTYGITEWLFGRKKRNSVNAQIYSIKYSIKCLKYISIYTEKSVSFLFWIKKCILQYSVQCHLPTWH